MQWEIKSRESSRNKHSTRLRVVTWSCGNATALLPENGPFPPDHLTPNRTQYHDQTTALNSRGFGDRNALRGKRLLDGFKEEFRRLDIETVAVEKWNGKGGNVDPRLISEAYRRLFIEKAPSKLVLVSGDKDYEPMLADYKKAS